MFGIFLSHSNGGAFSCAFCSLLALSTTEIRTSTDIQWQGRNTSSERAAAVSGGRVETLGSAHS